MPRNRFPSAIFWGVMNDLEILEQQAIDAAINLDWKTAISINKKITKKDEEEPAMECVNHPFPSVFDYIDCSVYQETFKSTSRKNDVIPTKDFQYSDVLSGNSITDMELL